MTSARLHGALSLPKTIAFIIAGTVALSLLFITFWNRLNAKIEDILKEQFNQQQLMLAKKIADNIEAYFDFLELELMAFPWRFRAISPEVPEFSSYMQSRFRDLERMGVLAIRLYDAKGRLLTSWGTEEESGTPLSPPQTAWLQDPRHRGRLYLSQVQRSDLPPFKNRLIMSLLTPLYQGSDDEALAGGLEFVINPFYIAGQVTREVRSGRTGYPWIIDQNGIFLAHYETSFVGHEALQVRRERNPQIVFRGLKEMHDRIFRGEEGTTEYVSGWHRQKLGEMPKLAAFTVVRFDKGLIRGVTDLENPQHNLWGVALAAPVEEVAGSVAEVMHQELFLVALFFLVIILTTATLILVAYSWNRTLAREVERKTEELVESHERLVRSERFAAIGEAAAYVSHEIKNPLMLIGGLAQQVARKLTQEPGLQEKLRIIQGEVRRLEDFLGDLRDFTRPALPVKQKLDINEVIWEIFALMEGEAKSRKVELVLNLAPELPPVEADANQMKQVLLNLVKNGLEAMDAGGRLTLASGAASRQVWFSVQDTGIGMPPEVLEKIFNPFFTTKAKGTGLGLAVIHKIITDHQGTISVESSPDQGSTFTVKLPQAH